MLIYSMSVSVDGFIADREGSFEWTPPDDDQLSCSANPTMIPSGPRT